MLRQPLKREGAPGPKPQGMKGTKPRRGCVSGAGVKPTNRAGLDVPVGIRTQKRGRAAPKGGIGGTDWETTILRQATNALNIASGRME